MATCDRRDLPTGITPKLRTRGSQRVPVTTPEGTPVYRVWLWDPVLNGRSSGRPRAWTRQLSGPSPDPSVSTALHFPRLRRRGPGGHHQTRLQAVAAGDGGA
jgi:hypothetical protein